MIKVSVMYPNAPGARFDIDYYKNKHIPMVKARLGDACINITLDKGMLGFSGTPAIYSVMCHIFSESVEVFLEAFEPNLNEFNADLSNFTDLKSVIQVSEVVLGSVPSV